MAIQLAEVLHKIHHHTHYNRVMFDNNRAIRVSPGLASLVNFILSNNVKPKCVCCHTHASHIDKVHDAYRIVCNNGRALTIDHIVPQAKGGRDQYSNFQLMCSKCNSIKSDMMFDNLMQLRLHIVKWHFNYAHRLLCNKLKYWNYKALTLIWKQPQLVFLIHRI